MSCRIRNLALGIAIITTLYFLLHSFHVGPREIETTTRKSLNAITHFTPEKWRIRGSSRIAKVSGLSGHGNELYTAALRSHDEHNRLYGYEMMTLREDIVDTYHAKTTYLLSIIMNELSKEEEERKTWLLWTDPDIVVTNPQIPLEIFLPQDQAFDRINFLATHDETGTFDSGVFFIRVHKWSVQMLIEVLAIGKGTPAIDQSDNKASKAFDMVLRSDGLCDHVVYQPREWYNSYPPTPEAPVNLFVHFHELGGDRWSAMSNTLDKLDARAIPKVPLKKTTYDADIKDYWARFYAAWDLVNNVGPKWKEEPIEEAVRRVTYALTFEADNDVVMNEAIEKLRAVLET